MKYVRFEAQGKIAHGVLAGEIIQEMAGDFFSHSDLTGNQYKLAEVTLLAPCQPSKAVCVGVNYRDHAAEMKHELPKEPLIFIKPATALNNPGGEIRYPAISHNVHHEGELAVVIGKTAKHVKAAQATEYILGYTCANDVTARDIQMRDGQWTRGKGFDTFMPLGPWLETELDPHAAAIKCLVNGQIRQSSNTGNLIFRIPELVEFITQVMTLNPGDVILTGTPSGVGPINIGDTVSVVIDGIGELKNTVVAG